MAQQLGLLNNGGGEEFKAWSLCVSLSVLELSL